MTRRVDESVLAGTKPPLHGASPNAPVRGFVSWDNMRLYYVAKSTFYAAL
jgi:hypothetical protein